MYSTVQKSKFTTSFVFIVYPFSPQSVTCKISRKYNRFTKLMSAKVFIGMVHEETTKKMNFKLFIQ